MDRAESGRWWGWAGWVVRGWRARMAATVGLLVGGLVWIGVYLVAWSARVPWYVDLVIVLTSLVVVPVAVVAVWVSWLHGVRRRLWNSCVEPP